VTTIKVRKNDLLVY